jgi:hypothetical protein
MFSLYQLQALPFTLCPQVCDVDLTEAWLSLIYYCNFNKTLLLKFQYDQVDVTTLFEFKKWGGGGRRASVASGNVGTDFQQVVACGER